MKLDPRQVPTIVAIQPASDRRQADNHRDLFNVEPLPTLGGFYTVTAVAHAPHALDFAPMCGGNAQIIGAQ